MRSSEMAKRFISFLKEDDRSGFAAEALSVMQNKSVDRFTDALDTVKADIEIPALTDFAKQYLAMSSIVTSVKSEDEEDPMPYHVHPKDKMAVRCFASRLIFSACDEMLASNGSLDPAVSKALNISDPQIKFDKEKGIINSMVTSLAHYIFSRMLTTKEYQIDLSARFEKMGTLDADSQFMFGITQSAIEQTIRESLKDPSFLQNTIARRQQLLQLFDKESPIVKTALARPEFGESYNLTEYCNSAVNAAFKGIFAEIEKLMKDYPDQCKALYPDIEKITQCFMNIIQELSSLGEEKEINFPQIKANIDAVIGIVNKAKIATEPSGIFGFSFFQSSDLRMMPFKAHLDLLTQTIEISRAIHSNVNAVLSRGIEQDAQVGEEKEVKHVGDGNEPAVIHMQAPQGLTRGDVRGVLEKFYRPTGTFRSSEINNLYGLITPYGTSDHIFVSPEEIKAALSSEHRKKLFDGSEESPDHTSTDKVIVELRKASNPPNGFTCLQLWNILATYKPPMGSTETEKPEEIKKLRQIIKTDKPLATTLVTQEEIEIALRSSEHGQRLFDGSDSPAATQDEDRVIVAIRTAFKR